MKTLALLQAATLALAASASAQEYYSDQYTAHYAAPEAAQYTQPQQYATSDYSDQYADSTQYIITTAESTQVPASEYVSSTEATSEYAAPEATLAIAKPIVDCASLKSTALTDIGDVGSSITSASESTSGGTKYCTVSGELATNVGFQVMLPVSTWTQRYMQTGCGGLCGMISLRASVADGSKEVTSGGFILASTDMASGNDGSFALDRERRVGFAYRAVHWTSLTAKKLANAYYGQEPKYSYFNGCSDGGREAMMEAIRCPNDFNGIIAGAPAMLFLFQNTLHHGWLSRLNADAQGNRVVLSSRLSILHNAVVASCDALDCVKDGLLSDPRLCNFNVASIQCAAGSTNTANCLTAVEVDAISKLYQGPVDPQTEAHLTVGEAQFGSELAWEGVFVPKRPQTRS